MNEGYENLRCAIVLQAVKDYRRALKFGGSRYGSRYDIESLERWFLSDWGQTLSCNNGARIIETVKREVRGGKNGRKQN